MGCFVFFISPPARAPNPAPRRGGGGPAPAAPPLRASTGRRGEDPTAARLVSDLLRDSEEFTRYWNDMAVEPLQSTRKQLNHPQAGSLDVQCDVVLSTTTGHRMVIFRPQPGSTTAESFAFLGVLGTQAFTT
ncbi:hypothetical protein ACFTY7_05805 [Streptomyces sp. NPDC057062]|uniref:MmyB family transcriptional regulator n=1 Tax=Streptomyces sp. NPDC057062 TaxID=3346011 RepID=UPI00363822FE